jgi:hypothetical protein
MLTGLYAKLIGAGIFLALIAGACLYLHHMGATSQKAVDDKVITAQKTEIAGYQAQAAANASIFLQMNATAENAKADAALQKTYADAALQQLHTDQAKQQAADTAWRTKLADAVKSKGCQTQLEAKLCDAVPAY